MFEEICVTVWISITVLAGIYAIAERIIEYIKHTKRGE
jgi:hypothetical protein